MRLKWAKKILRKLPLLGGLAHCRLSDHEDASKEFGVNFVFSTAPIWLGGLIIFALDQAQNKTFFSLLIAMIGTVRGGELFMYSTAMVAPIVYLALKPEKGVPIFPGQMSHVVFITIVAIVSSAFFAIQRTGVWIDTNITFPLSVGLYILSLILLYLATVYKNYQLTGAPDEARGQTAEFVEEFNLRHKKRRRKR